MVTCSCRQEIKFRNKLVDYLSDWTMGNAQMHQLGLQASAVGASCGTLTSSSNALGMGVGVTLGLPPAAAAPGSVVELLALSRELDLACMQAIAALLQDLPLQPEDSDRGDLMEAKSHLFAKYIALQTNTYSTVYLFVLVQFCI